MASLFYVALAISLIASNEVSASNCSTVGAHQAITRFSASLYQAAVRESGAAENVILSPSGIATVVGMTLAGAKGNSAIQLKGALGMAHLGDPVCAIGQFSRDGRMLETFKSVNRMLVASTFRQQQSFKSTLSEQFGVTAESVDFTTDETRKSLNRYVEMQTNDEIKNLFSPGTFSGLTKVVLLNANLFNGKWQTKFGPEKVKARPFYRASSQQPVMTMMMRSRGFFRTADLPTVDAKAIQLPYSDDRMSMIIILPNQMDGLAQLESTLLSSNLLNTLDDELYRAPCAVTVPKFTIDSSLDLKSVLKRLGVHDLFDSAVADLSGIDGSRMLYVSDAFQRAFIRVNEEGTKAASATAVVVSARNAGASRPSKYRKFRADHPFIFIIRDDVSKTVHFMGRYVTPKAVD